MVINKKKRALLKYEVLKYTLEEESLDYLLYAIHDAMDLFY